MRISDLKTVGEHMPVDDKTLVKAYTRLKKEFYTKKNDFQRNLANSDENNYLPLMMARLKYEFVKEEYDMVNSEISRRGIITQT